MRARPEHLEILRAVPFVRTGVVERVREAGAVEVAGGVGGDAGTFEDGGHHVDRVRELAAHPARRRRVAAVPDAGHDTMHGSATPPSCTSRFQRRNGVFPAIVQPHG